MTAFVTILIIALIIWVGLKLHHIFEGEWLPHDILREFKLSRLELSHLDQRWQDTAQKSGITVTLTTTPSRIGLLHHTLKSLLDQSVPPTKIILNVPNFSIRENVAYTIPDSLKNLASVEIHRTEDLGPGTKLIPTLSQVAPNAPVLVVDDDRIYPKWLLERYQAARTTHPDKALTMGGWVVPETLIDTFTTIKSSFLMQPPAPIRAPRLRTPREVDIALGVFSYLVEPSFFEIEEMQDLSQGPAELRYVDDVRTSALCQKPILVIPAPSLSFVPWRQRAQFQNTRLGLFNRGAGSGTRHNTIAIQHYADRWRVGGPKQS